jgi:hypothetical protein
MVNRFTSFSDPNGYLNATYITDGPVYEMNGLSCSTSTVTITVTDSCPIVDRDISVREDTSMNVLV